MSKLFLKNIKCGAKVKIKQGAAVVDNNDVSYYWPTKNKDVIFTVVYNEHFTKYVVKSNNETLITNMHNLTIL